MTESTARMEHPLQQYDYSYPPEALATRPASPPEAARLFVYDVARDEVTMTTFADIARHMPERALVVRNVTRVVPARVTLVVDNRAYEGIVLANEPLEGGLVRALVAGARDEGAVALLGGAEVRFVRRDGAAWLLAIDGVQSREELLAFLERAGSTPLPPYIGTRTTLSEEEAAREYQTPFAREGASVASPTASLHFPPVVVDSMTAAGHEFADVVLNVGRGTFAPVTADMLAAGALHKEEYEVPEQTAAAVDAARAAGRSVVAIGTTTARALESRAVRNADRGWTDLFIYPPYEFRAIDALVTNFHVPKSSLMAMVDAFLLHKGSRRGIVSLYEQAVAAGFRLFSFGDGMLIK